MEIWFNTDKRKVRLPVMPPSFTINGGTVETSFNLLGNGEASLYSGNKIQEGEISCFFPKQNYSFNEYKDPADPYVFVKIFRTWMNSGQVVQFIITEGILSFPVRIVGFEYGEKDGTKDVYYTLKWKEVRQVKVRKLSQSNTNNSNQNNSRPNDQTQDKVDSNKQKTHKVVKGDNLYDIAAKYYGKGSEYPKIKKANEAKYPSLKKNNVIYVNWNLVIP